MESSKEQHLSLIEHYKSLSFDQYIASLLNKSIFKKKKKSY